MGLGATPPGPYNVFVGIDLPFFNLTLVAVAPVTRSIQEDFNATLSQFLQGKFG